MFEIEFVIVLPPVPASTFATIVNVAFALLFNVPTVQFGDVQVPVEGVALTKVNPMGKLSVTTKFEACAEPLFVTVMV